LGDLCRHITSILGFRVSRAARLRQLTALRTGRVELPYHARTHSNGCQCGRASCTGVPNTFRLAFANRHYRAIRLTCTHVEPDRGTLEKVVALNLTLDEPIGYYSLLSKNKRAARGPRLKIIRPGKSLILDLDLLSDPTQLRVGSC